MNTEKAARHWQDLSTQSMSAVVEWRKCHPKATLKEIEEALDEQIMKLRAQILGEAAQLSDMRNWTESGAIPICPDCKEALEFRVKGKRELQTHGGHSVRLEREYGICPKCGQGFFPPG